MSMSAATEQIMFNEMMRVRKRGKYSPRESNYTRLFGTPERAARTLCDVVSCVEAAIDCDACEFSSLCARTGDYDALLEWLGGDAEWT